METARTLTGRRRWWVWLGVLLLTGCAAVTRAPLPRTATPTPWLPPTESVTLTPTPAPSATQTPTPLPTATPTPLACWGKGGRLLFVHLPSRFLPYEMPVVVYLPPCYDQQPDRRYPVLYLIHGQNFDERQWVRLGATDAADRLIAAGQAPPFLIVMPGERTWEEPAQTGWDETFLQVLMPWVAQTFRTRDERRYCAIGGLSRGASWAIHLGLSHWQLFGSIGGHSPPVFWEDVPHIRGWLAAIPADARPRIYLDIGDADQKQILSSAQWFEGVLTAEDYPHEWHFNVGRHNEAYWRAHVDAYLRWYTAAWK